MTDKEIWENLSDREKAVCTKCARTLIKGSQRFAKRVMTWGVNVDRENNCLQHLAFEANESLVGSIDKATERQLKRLLNEGVNRPLLPLCISIWNEGMSLSEDDFREKQDEWALTLLMLRIQDTVYLARQKIACCESKEVDMELERRGII